MTENPGDASLDPREGLTEQLRLLEAFVARAEAEGEALPAAAVEMVDRLKEIMEALEGLTTTFGERDAATPETPAPE